MRAENPFKLSANAFDRRPRPLVASIRVQTHSEHLPTFKSMRQHKQLGLGVGRRPNCRPRQPRVTNLADIGNIPPMPSMARWPSPSLHVEKPRRPNDDTVLNPDSSERHRSPSISPSQSSFDVADDVALVLRNRTPLVEGSVSRRSGNQSVSMPLIQRFKTNVPANQHQILDFRFTSNAPPLPNSSGRRPSRRAPTWAWRI